MMWWSCWCGRANLANGK